MGFGRGVLLTVLSVLLVLSVFLLGIFWSVHAFLYPQIYEKTLTDNNAYNLVNISQIPGGDFIKLPSGGMPALVNGLLENTLSYLRGDSNTLNLTVQIDTSKITSMFTSSLGNLPPCNPGQQPFQGNIPVCMPSAADQTAFASQILKANGLNVSSNGDINLINVLNIPTSNIEQVRGYVMLYEKALYGLAIIALVLSVIIFFASPSRTRWTGIDFALGGALVLLLGSIAFPLLMSFIPTQIVFIKTISQQIVGFLTQRVNTYAFVVIGIGIAAFVLSFFIKKIESLLNIRSPKNKGNTNMTPHEKFMVQQKNSTKRKR